MNTFTRTWTAGREIDPKEASIPVRQVYVWILTTDKHVVLVSKDGDTWQLPGGKPEVYESLVETAKREVDEETGVDITPYESDLEFFGYYTVNEPAADPATYLQIRYALNLPISSGMLNPNVDRENMHQANEDVIRYVDTVGVSEVATRIPWMSEVEEYRYLIHPLLINK